MKINRLWVFLLGFTCFAVCGSSLAQEPQGISLPKSFARFSTFVFASVTRTRVATRTLADILPAPTTYGEPDNQGIYEVTVRRATDDEVLFVDPAGRLVRQQTVAVTTPVQTTRPMVTEEPSTPGVNTFVRSLDNARYQLIEKKGDKEVYRNRATGTKWAVEVHRKGD